MEQIDYFTTGLAIGLGVWLGTLASHRVWCFFKSLLS